MSKIKLARSRLKSIRNHFFPWFPLPVKLPYGAWWLASTDYCSSAIFDGCFENGERKFVENFLTDGMCMFDIGAHHGFYTLAASKKVGLSGKVFAFEPSPRERTRLIWHIVLNRRRNIKVEPFALGDCNGQATLFVVQRWNTGCNSLRPVSVPEPTRDVTVQVKRLDDYIKQEHISCVDFIKLDVEGAELEVFRGSRDLLERRPRPVIMCEVQDVRTAPWGYSASLIYDFLVDREFEWFSVTPEGELFPCTRSNYYDANLIAVPEERIPAVKLLFKETRQKTSTHGSVGI